MASCKRCGSTNAAWFTPTRLERYGGIFLCLDCSQINVQISGLQPRLEPVPIRVRDRR